jgi:hypothetical protein
MATRTSIAIIGYVWDTTTPVATIAKAEDRHGTFVVLRSASDLGKWLTERRNVAEDYTKIFGEARKIPKPSRSPSTRMTLTRWPSSQQAQSFSSMISAFQRVADRVRSAYLLSKNHTESFGTNRLRFPVEVTEHEPVLIELAHAAVV